MSQKVVIIADPGIDTAFAIALALHDPRLDVIGLLATAGNVTPEQATRNVHILIDQIDPPKRPRIGTALPVNYELTGEVLHGRDGLGETSFPCVIPHQQTLSDKLLVELVRTYPHEIALLILGPCTAAATTFQYETDIPELLDHIFVVGGTWHEPGNASPVAEFHFYCDPPAARQVLHCAAPVTLLPLDITRQLILSPTDLLNLPKPASRTCQFLRAIVPHAVRETSNLYGIEGFHLKDVVGVIAASHRSAVTVSEMPVDVETKGELTRGMSVVDARGLGVAPNVFLAREIDLTVARTYIDTILRTAV